MIAVAVQWAERIVRKIALAAYGVFIEGKEGRSKGVRLSDQTAQEVLQPPGAQTDSRGGRPVAILGRGISVVAWVDDSELSVVLWSNLTLTSPAGKLPGNRQNMRWETDANDKLLREPIVVQLGPLSRPNIS